MATLPNPASAGRPPFRVRIRPAPAAPTTSIPGFVRSWKRVLWTSALLGALLPTAGARPGLPVPPGIGQGELLLGHLQCVRCHTAADPVADRLATAPAPVLGPSALRLTPGWLRLWLPTHGTLAEGNPNLPGQGPDLLHDLTATERQERVEDLVHYLVSIQPSDTAKPLGADPARMRLGGRLFHSLGCVACHAPEDRPEGIPAETLTTLATHSVPLRDLARKYPAGELVRFLMDPVRYRPSGRMPGFNLSAAEATALATYLLRDQASADAGAKSPAKTLAGLRWEYFEGTVRECRDLDGLSPADSGESPTVTTSMARRSQDFGLRFTGVLQIPTPGEYSFWIRSDDGSTLDIDGERVVSNDGIHAPSEQRGRIRLDPGPHTFECRFIQGGGGYELAVEWAGPGIQRQTLPAEVLGHVGEPLVALGSGPFTVDPTRASRGAAIFADRNCAACHEGTGTTPRTAKPLSELASRNHEGCLSERPPAAAPRFTLEADERESLQRVLSQVPALAQTLPPHLAVRTTLARLNCYACHRRDGFGGPAENGRDAWFRVLGEADLGEEGRLPPHLEAVGGKLRQEWLETLLRTGRKVRPYMATRMPVFGPQAIGPLPSLLAAADVAPSAEPEPELTRRDAKYGRRLVGRDGLGCIQCHTFTTYGSLGIPALSLELMYERLRWDWVRRYLPDPAALRPGTRMPTFWPEGRAVNTELLDGNTTDQIRAIFAWMRQGADADVPAGLVRSRHELVVDQEAVIYRNFIEGAGSRAIGVGYPEHANLAFDANDLRLALIWQGAFIDTARHDSDRGVGFEPPLGDHVVKFPTGPAFALLTSPEEAWPKSTQPQRAGQQFLGYSLDALRRPAFRYAVGEVEIRDFVAPRVEDVDIRLVRTLRLSGTTGTGPGQLWFRAAAGTLQPQADGSFLLDQSVRIRVRGGGDPRVVGNELRVPVPVPGELTEEISW